jgi:hypothetical protein
MQHLNSGFNKFKVDDSTHVKMWKNSLNHPNIIVKYWIVCVLIYHNECKMQFVNNNFNILKMNGSILIIEEIWKKLLIHSNINVRFKIVTCVLTNYGMCKMQLLNNCFNSCTLLIVEKMSKKSLTHYNILCK